MSTQIFQTAMLVMMCATLLGVGGIVVWIFELGRWIGMVDTELEGNRVDHKRYEEIFQGMS